MEKKLSRWTANEIVQKRIDELIPYDRNPRKHPDSQIEELANSIRQWGFTAPILIDEGGVVIAGHGRLFAAQTLDMQEVPTIIAEGWTDAQKKAYVIADNKLAEGSDWDSPVLFAELRELASQNFNLDFIGFDNDMDLEFNPNLMPETSYPETTESDVALARSSMSENLDRLTADRSAKGVEVMCPYCAESFTFDGI